MRKKIIIIEIAIILFFILLVITVSFLINIFMYKYFLKIKDDVFYNLKELTGFDISYKKIAPDIFGKIKICQVVAYKDNDIKLELGDIEIYYTLAGILEQEKTFFTFIKKIKFKSLDVKINLNNKENINDINNLISHIKKRIKPGKKINIDNFTIEIPNGSILILNNEYKYSINTNKFKININDNIKIDTLFNITINNENKEILFSRIKSNGIIKNISTNIETDFNIILEKTIINEKQIKLQRFSFNSKEQNLVFKRIEDSLPIKFIIKKENNNIIADIDIDELNTKKLFYDNDKIIFLPDILTFSTNLNYNLKSTTSNGKITLNFLYDKLFLLKNFGSDIKVSINNNLININKCRIYNINKKNNISIYGKIPLNDSDFKILVSVNDFILPLTKFNTKIHIIKNKNNINLFSDNFLLNNNDIGKFYINIINNPEIIKILTIKDFNGYKINGEFSKKESNDKYNIKHEFSNFSISKIIACYDENHNGNISINGYLKNSFSKNSLEVLDSNINVYNNEELMSLVNIKQTNKLINFNGCKFKTGKDFTTLNGWINLKQKPSLGLFELNNDYINYKILSRNEKDLFQIELENKIFITYDKNKNQINLRSENFRIPIKNSYTTISLNCLFDITQNQIQKNKIIIKNIKIFKEYTGNITSYFSYNNDKLIIDDFTYSDGYNYITGDSIHNFDLRKNNLLITGKGFFKDDNKDESFSIDYEIKKNDINAKFYATHIDINKFIKNNISGFLNLRVNVYGKLKKPKTEILFDLTNGKFGDKTLNSYLNINSDSNGINVKKAFFEIENNRLAIKEGQVIFQENNHKKLYFTGSIFINELQKKLKSNFMILGNFETKKDLPFDINFELNNITIGYMDGNYVSKTEKLDPLQLKITNNDGIFKLMNYGPKYIDITKSSEKLNIDLFNKNMQVLKSDINIKDKNLDGTLTFTKFPVNAIQKLLLPFVSIDTGFIDGQLELKGKQSSPEFYGNLNVYHGIVSIDDYLQESIINITGVIIAEKNKFLVRNVNAEVRKGLAHGYGEIVLNGWKFERYLFQVNSDLIPAHFNKGPVDAKGHGYINNFIFEGRPKDFNFIADLVVENADINLDSLLGLNKKRQLKKIPLNVYIKFTSGNKVKINYPIINGFVNPGEVFILKFIGEEPRVYLGGSISLKRGEVNYLNRKFKIEQADFLFDENEMMINPNVNLKAYYRTKDSKKEPIVIYLAMNNKLIPFNTKFTSFPYKTEEEISAMLGLSYSLKNTEESSDFVFQDSQNNQDNNIETIVDTTNYISNSFIFTPIENRIRKVTSLDTFSLDTDIFGNILRVNSEDSSNTLDLLDDTSITIGKYLFNELYFESMMSFDKRDEVINEFFLPLQDENHGFNLQFMLQLELPYLLIGYSFLPNDYNNLLNSDHEFSLEFNYKF